MAASKKIARNTDRELATKLPFVCHGSHLLPAVSVDSYNIELREHRHFIGDRANKKAFASLIDKWRKLSARQGSDPFQDIGAEQPTRKQLEEALAEGRSKAAGIVHAAIEDFSTQLADVVESYLDLDEWKKVSLILVGGGLRGSRVGEIVIGRTQAALYQRKIKVDFRPIRADPDEAGLLGSVFLVPGWILRGFDGALAVDLGGTNFRAGVVTFRVSRKRQTIRAKVAKMSVWEHAKENPARGQAIEQLESMLKKMLGWAKRNRFRLAPFVGIGCPGRIRIDGAIDRGAQNLPGNWQSDSFNLPKYLSEHIRISAKEQTVAVMHNDAVLQGLSQMPFLGEVTEWAVLTIGTGLGNAKFTTRRIQGR